MKSLENVINSTKRVLGRYLLASTILVSPLLNGCGNSEVNLPKELERCVASINNNPQNNKGNAVLADRVGTMYLMVNELELAESWYKSSLELDPSARTYSNIAEVYIFKNDFDKSLEMLKKGLKLDPNYYRIHDRLGEIYLKNLVSNSGEKDNAYKLGLEESRKAVELNPRSADANVQLGVAYLLNGNYEESIDYLQDAIKIDRDRSDAYYIMGFSYYKEGKKKKALSVWKHLSKVGNPAYTGLLENPIRMAEGKDPVMGGYLGGFNGFMLRLGDDGTYHKTLTLMYSRTLENDVDYTGVNELFDARFVHIFFPMED